MRHQFAPYGPAHAAAAAVLAAARTAALRGAVPFVDARWSDPATWLPVATDVAANGLGIVALDPETGAVVGVLAGWPVPGTDPRIYCPDGTAGVLPGLEAHDARRTGELLLAHAMDAWVGAGIRSYVISTPPSDGAWVELLHWHGFGAVGVDALVPVESLLASTGSVAPPEGIRIVRAGPSDLDAVLAMEAGLRAHLAGSPAWLVIPHPTDRAEHTAALADPAYGVLLAQDAAGETIALLRIGPTADDVAQVIHAPATLSISRAFTLPEHRGGGVAAALLHAAGVFARDAGATRIGVDFESANFLASRFWLAHFTPVSIAHARRLHPLAGTPAANP